MDLSFVGLPDQIFFKQRFRALTNINIKKTGAALKH
jgi:hypothetical protein